jgi:type IV secretory pathway TrbD component
MVADSAPARYVDRDVVGTPDQVANVLRNAASRGRLVAATAPVGVPGDPYRVRLRVRFRAPSPGPTARRAPVRRSVRRRLLASGAVVTAASGVLAGAVYLVWLAVQALIAAGPVLLIALTVALLIWLALRRVGVCCPGLHCPGCRH